MAEQEDFIESRKRKEKVIEAIKWHVNLSDTGVLIGNLVAELKDSMAKNERLMKMVGCSNSLPDFGAQLEGTTNHAEKIDVNQPTEKVDGEEGASIDCCKL